MSEQTKLIGKEWADGSHVNGVDDHIPPDETQRNDVVTGYQYVDFCDYVDLVNIITTGMHVVMVPNDVCSFNAVTGSLTVTMPPGRVSAGDYVAAFDGTHRWFVSAIAADNQVVLTDANMQTGSAVSDYTSYTTTSLYLLCFPGSGAENIDKPIMSYRQVNLDGSSDEALSAEQIPYDSSDSMKDVFDDLKTRVDVALKASGQLQDDIVIATAVKADDALVEEGFANLVDGGMEAWPGGNYNPPLGFEDYNASEIFQESSEKASGSYSVRVVSGAGERGIKCEIKDFERLKGKTICISGKFKQYNGSTAGVIIRADDGVSADDSDRHVLTGDFETVYLEYAVDSAATELWLYFISYAGEASQFYLDEVAISVGTKHKAYERSNREWFNNLNLLSANWLINGGFDLFYDVFGADNHDSSFDCSTLPIGWLKHGSGELEVESSTDEFTGLNSVKMSGGAVLAGVGAGTGIYQDLSALDEVMQALGKAEEITFSIWAKIDSSDPASNTWRISLYDGSTETCVDFEASELSDTAYTHLAVTAPIDSPATLHCRVYAVDGEAAPDDAIYFDGACLNIGDTAAPGAGYSESSVWQIVEHEFVHDGAISTGNCVGKIKPCTRPFLPFILDVYEGTTSGGGPGALTRYTLQSATRNNVLGSMTLAGELVGVTGSEDQTKTFANSIAGAATDRIEENMIFAILATEVSIMSSAEDVVCRVLGYSLVI